MITYKKDGFTLSLVLGNLGLCDREGYLGFLGGFFVLDWEMVWILRVQKMGFLGWG